MPVLPDRRAALNGAALNGNAGPPGYAAISPPSNAAEPVEEDLEKSPVIDFPPAGAEEASSSLPRS
jgi:hypothetical protein